MSGSGSGDFLMTQCPCQEHQVPSHFAQEHWLSRYVNVCAAKVKNFIQKTMKLYIHCMRSTVLGRLLKDVILSRPLYSDRIKNMQIIVIKDKMYSRLPLAHSFSPPTSWSPSPLRVTF